MIYPCTDCLVDVMCIDPCDKFTSFMIEFNSHPTWYHDQHLRQMVSTSPRFKRSRYCAMIYLHSLSLKQLLDTRKEKIRNEKRII